MVGMSRMLLALLVGHGFAFSATTLGVISLGSHDREWFVAYDVIVTGSVIASALGPIAVVDVVVLWVVYI